MNNSETYLSCSSPTLLSRIIKLNMSVHYFIYTGGMQVVPKNVTHVRFDPSVTHIATVAFQDCSALVNVELHNGIRTIGKRAFQNCTALNDIDLPDGLQRIKEWAFLSCSSLIRIIVPPTVIDIGESAFLKCIVLMEVVFHEGLQRIEKSAFSGCPLLGVKIPSSITSIGTMHLHVNS